MGDLIINYGTQYADQMLNSMQHQYHLPVGISTASLVCSAKFYKFDGMATERKCRRSAVRVSSE
jgi:hypothetical protein